MFVEEIRSGSKIVTHVVAIFCSPRAMAGPLSGELGLRHACSADAVLAGPFAAAESSNTRGVLTACPGEPSVKGSARFALGSGPLLLPKPSASAAIAT